MSKLKVFEAFAGVGSQSMALRNIGIDYEVVGISEVDRYAIMSYWAIHHNGKIEYDYTNTTKKEILEEIANKNIAYNFSTYKSEIPKNDNKLIKLYNAHKVIKNYGDIRLINENELPIFDLFTYSFPCKNISTSGKQAGLKEGSNTQSSLIWECRRIIKSKRPKYLMMENVKNLVGEKHKPFFDLWCKELEDMGYNNYWKVLNGKHFSVPQNRERVIMISILKEYDKGYEMPTTDKLPMKCIKDILTNDVDEKLYLNKKFILNNNYSNNKEIIISARLEDNRSDRSRIVNTNGIMYTLDSMNGGAREPKILVNKNDNINVYSVSGYMVRKLSPLECWRLMGYSDEDFIKARDIGELSNSKLYERAGRGIVVPMLEKVFEELLLK